MREEQEFFEHWKHAVQIAGIGFFGDGTREGFESAKSKNDLRPNVPKIQKASPGLSPGEVIFFGAMLAFYNNFASLELMQENELSTEIRNLLRLDSKRRASVMSLLRTYPGW